MHCAVGLLLVLGVAPAPAQIVNTLDGFDPDERGTSGSAAVGFDAQGGNTDVVEIGAEGNLRFVTDRHTLRLMAGYDFEQADGEDQSDDSFVHLRHNRRLTHGLHSLLFAQWQRNPFQRLTRRVLLGAGARFDALADERGHLTLGAAHMAEFERVEDIDDTTAQRLSAYLDTSWSVGKATVAANTFVQPRWSDFGDVRAIGSLGIESPLGGGLALGFTGTVTYDARPPDDVEETDWEVTTGFRYAF